MRRIATTLRLGYKQQADTALLIRAIDEDRRARESFIQKAIDWTLHGYSKTDAAQTKSQLTTDSTELAVREASKYL